MNIGFLWSLSFRKWAPENHERLREYPYAMTYAGSRGLVSIILHKNLLYRVISSYCGENISNVNWKYIEKLENIYNVVSVLSFGSGSVPVR